jgi:chromosome segregation ATPase
MLNEDGNGSPQNFSLLKLFKSSKVSQPPRVEAQPEQPEPQPVETIRALGGRSEHLRSRCESVLTTVATFRSASDEIDALFREFNLIVVELQERSNALAETEAALKAEIRSTQDQIEENAILRANISKFEYEIESLSAAHVNSERRRERLEESFRAAQAELEDKTQTLRSVEIERTTVMGRAQQLANEGAQLAQKLKETETALEEARTQRRAAQDNLQLEIQERLKLVEGNKELTNMYSQEKTNFLEASAELDKVKKTLTEVEAQLGAANAAADSLRAALRSSESRRETDEVGFILKIETLTSRLELTEQLLSRTREEAHRLGEEQMLHGETSRRLQQVQAEAGILQGKLEKSLRYSAELEKSRDAITARANDHLNELREKRALNEQAAERLAALQKFIETLKADKDKDIEKLKEQVKQLTEALAKEHAAREYAEGSLQAARRDRVQLQNTIMQTDTGRVEKTTGLSAMDVAQASSKDLFELQSKLGDGGKSGVENLPRTKGVL